MWRCSSDDACWCFISVGFFVESEEVTSGRWFVSVGFKEPLGVDCSGRDSWFLSWPSFSEFDELSEWFLL